MRNPLYGPREKLRRPRPPLQPSPPPVDRRIQVLVSWDEDAQRWKAEGQVDGNTVVTGTAKREHDAVGNLWAAVKQWLKDHPA